MNTELVDHRIFAQNLLLGESLFLTLKLPPQWDLAPGVSRPEVHATHERRERRWVASGDAWYVIYHREHRWALEVAITTRPLRRGASVSSQAALSVGGHAATVRWKQKRRGLPWQRHDVTFMIVEFACPASERSFKLEFSGWCPQEGFDEILAALRQVRCH